MPFVIALKESVSQISACKEMGTSVKSGGGCGETRRMQEGGNARSRNVPREDKKEGKRPSILLRTAQNERVSKERKKERARESTSESGKKHNGAHREKKERIGGRGRKTRRSSEKRMDAQSRNNRGR